MIDSINKHKEDQKKLVILVTGGCFNPIHKMHVEIFNIAMSKLDSDTLEVVGGFIVPTSNFYVRAKLRNDKKWSISYSNLLTLFQ